VAISIDPIEIASGLSPLATTDGAGIASADFVSLAMTEEKVLRNDKRR